ncbi:MAG: hypothetical protein KC983_06245 [Phycisphaerales bacterium]|nr:hypothetical protein [Phycisphaerales bacterium]
MTKYKTILESSTVRYAVLAFIWLIAVVFGWTDLIPVGDIERELGEVGLGLALIAKIIHGRVKADTMIKLPGKGNLIGPCLAMAIILPAVTSCTTAFQRANLTEEQGNRLDVSEATIAFDAARNVVLTARRNGLISARDFLQIATYEASARVALQAAQNNPNAASLELVNAALDEFERQYLERITRNNSDP